MIEQLESREVAGLQGNSSNAVAKGGLDIFGIKAFDPDQKLNYEDALRYQTTTERSKNIYDASVENDLRGRLSRKRSGFFITIDSTVTDYSGKNFKNISGTDVSYFEEKLNDFGVQLNKYCFGRGYCRGENRFEIFGAMEIGKVTNRLHAHFVALSEIASRRSVVDIEKKIRFAILPNLNFTAGRNGFDFKVYDPTKKEELLPYLTKSRDDMKQRFGFESLVFLGARPQN